MSPGGLLAVTAALCLIAAVAGTAQQWEQTGGVRIVQEPTDVVVPAGGTVVLPCGTTAGGPLKVRWRYRKDEPPTHDHLLPEDDAQRRQLANGSLQISSMQSSLAGHYQCVASGVDAGTVVSRVAVLYLAELTGVDGAPRSVLGAAGGAVLLSCGARAGGRVVLRVVNSDTPDRRIHATRPAVLLPPTLNVNVTWLKNGVPVTLETARSWVTTSGALEIEPARPDDAASYVCRVHLSADNYMDSEPTELQISTELALVETPPRFIATPRSATVMEGASVTFDCAAVGNPKPEVVWLNNGVAIDLNDLDSRLHVSGAGSLRVVSARAVDAGSYTCRAANRLDAADHTALLLVMSPPRVSVPSPVVQAASRGDVTLPCTVRGRPPPTVRWLKDGEPLTPNDHDIALVDGHDLRIQGVLLVDAGMFQCFASSPAGDAVAAVRLNVVAADDASPHLKSSSSPLPHDIFSSLIPEESLSDLDSDFLDETDPAYTPEPDTIIAYNDYDAISHAAKGLDLDDVNETMSEPRDLRALLVKHRFVTLSWEQPEEAAGILGYIILYNVKGSLRQRTARSSSPRREYNVASLQPNTTYQFRVRALGEDAVSPPSQMVEVHTPPEEFLWPAPSSVRALPGGPHAVTVTWRAPDPAPPTYRVLYVETESGREQWASTSSTSCNLVELRAGVVYSIVVSGVGGAPSAEVTVRTPSDVPAAPPGNVTAVTLTDTSLSVQWAPPPARTHRGPLTGYKLRYRAVSSLPGATRKKADSLTTPADVRRADLTGLDRATTYQIRVCALNANGSGPFSEWVTATTSDSPARPDTSVPGAPPPLSTRAGRDWISVWWGGGAGEGRGYSLSWGRGVPDDHVRSLPAHAHSHLIRQLQSNSEYVIALRASNSLGLGPAVYATVRTRPPADLEGGDDNDDDGEEGGDDDVEGEEPPPLLPPVGLKVIMLSGTTAVVYWTDPTLPKGQAATDGRRYSVRWSTSGARARVFNSTELNCMIDDLKPFTTYDFAVKLIKGERESAWSLLVSNTTLEAAPGTAPRDVRLTAAGRGLELTWSPPARPNGHITGYVIMYAPQSRAGSASSGGEWTAVEVGGERRSARLERVRPRTSYVVKIQARTARGLGPLSSPAICSTPDDTGGALSGATSVWLWASAGGALAVLALAAALALSLCCRRPADHLPATDCSTYQKSSATAAIKPPDLWIHHDQMELKHLDKSMHSSASKISAGSMSVDAGPALMSSTLTLGRPPTEYEPAPRGGHLPHPPHPAHSGPPGSVDRRHYVPTYVDSRRSPSVAGSSGGDTAVMTSHMVCACARCLHEHTSMSGVGCTASCDRRAPMPPPGLSHLLVDQSTPLLSGVVSGGASSPQSSLASLHAPAASCGSSTCPLGASCGAAGGMGNMGSSMAHMGSNMGLMGNTMGSMVSTMGPMVSTMGPMVSTVGPMVGSVVPNPGGDIYAVAARERGQYVAYEPLGHYTHRDSLSSDGLVSGAGSLRRAPPPTSGGLHSFTVTSDASSNHSTPSHGQGSVRESSPYRKSAASSPGHTSNRLQLGPPVPHVTAELEPLSPSRGRSHSSERLQREMDNLEGLMKDLSNITHQHFHC